MKKILTIIISMFMFSLNSFADSIDADWKITGYVGERIFHHNEENKIVGKVQSFQIPNSAGPFFNGCAGIFHTSIKVYTHEEFFRNPEFELFKKYNIKFEKGKIYVHKITCGTSDPNKIKLMYPFVKQGWFVSNKAYYPFTGAIYSLERDKK